MMPGMDNSFREQMGRAAVDFFLETGKPARYADIAAKLGVSERKVRDAIRKDFWFVSGCDYHEVSVATYSKDYPSMQHGSSKAAAYMPTRETLRKLIIGKK